MNIHQRIKKAREAKGWSMQELAEKVGYSSRSAIARVEAGERSVNHEMLVKYAEALEVSPLWLLYGDEYERATKNELLEKAISTFGADAQLTVAIEELSELIKELCKAKRGAVRLENIIEEMADCHIMLDQLSLIFSIDYSEITAARAQKLNRLKERLEI